MVPIVQEAGWAPGPVWTGAESLAPTGIRSTDRPARSQLVYQLRYPAHDGPRREHVYPRKLAENVLHLSVIGRLKGVHSNFRSELIDSNNIWTQGLTMK
jgi:hypothetical protein